MLFCSSIKKITCSLHILLILLSVVTLKEKRKSYLSILFSKHLYHQSYIIFLLQKDIGCKNDQCNEDVTEFATIIPLLSLLFTHTRINSTWEKGNTCPWAIIYNNLLLFSVKRLLATYVSTCIESLILNDTI